MQNPYDIVRNFEAAVAEFTNAPFCVSVDSATSGLFLCLEYFQVDAVEVPCHTYVGVPHAVRHAGGFINFVDLKWQHSYELKPFPIIDSARTFKRAMYQPDTLTVVSFHWTKPLAIGRGGAILTDNAEAAKWLKRARFDGRTEDISVFDDKDLIDGWHMYLIPELAASGLVRMQSIGDGKEEGGWEDYPDLSIYRVFK